MNCPPVLICDIEYEDYDCSHTKKRLSLTKVSCWRGWTKAGMCKTSSSWPPISSPPLILACLPHRYWNRTTSITINHSDRGSHTSLENLLSAESHVHHSSPSSLSCDRPSAQRKTATSPTSSTSTSCAKRATLTRTSRSRRWPRKTSF
jgi:hypothetical protein